MFFWERDSLQQTTPADSRFLSKIRLQSPVKIIFFIMKILKIFQQIINVFFLLLTVLFQYWHYINLQGDSQNHQL